MPAQADVQTHYLGRDRPALRTAADWLVDVMAGASADLGEVLVVVPGRRAQRRLMELLAERSVGRALLPPRVATLGQLADRLMPETASPIAGELASLLTWAGVLREAEDELIGAVVPRAPGRDDWPGWWSLAEQVVRASDELGAHLLLVGDVADRLAGAGDEARWRALGELDRRYHEQLARRGQADRHRARLDAIHSGSCQHAGPIVLLGVADHQPVHEQMLARIASPIHALVFADRSDAEGFDRFGVFVERYWLERRLPIHDGVLIFADRPADQALAVLDTIARWSADGGTAADDITVGLGDTSLSGPIMRSLELAGLPARSAEGRPIARSRPALLLQALAGFATGLRFDKLAQLLRHPDAEAAITRSAGAPAEPWLSLLDRYATDHLAARPVGGWLGKDEQVRALDAVYRSACALLPEPAHPLRPLQEWAGVIGGALAEVYGERELNRHAEVDRAVVAALEAIGAVLESLQAVDPATAPHCTFAHAATLVLARLAGQAVPEPGGDPAVELVGFLELLLDDAPHLVITGMNEQHVPEPVRSSALLPEGVRRSLGMPGDSRRLARDAYALSAMLGCRAPGRVTLVAGKRSLDGDPLLPSRLLLREDDDTLVRRVSRFVAEQEETIDSAPMMLTPGPRDLFLIPPPVMPDPPITKLPVTAFRDYLACPYRFYLRHVRRLEPLDDKAMEVSAGGFGTLAHESLRVLAGADMRDVDDPDTIAGRLGLSLDRAFRQRYGADPPVAARIQAEQLRFRLEQYAKVHARFIAEGWRIEKEERRLETTFEVDGVPFTITGQIDRIDRHRGGRWRLIDYKTSDTGKTPEQTHRATVEGERVWTDLQLPLYLDLSSGLGVDHSAELGYINLPKKRSDTGFEGAPWSADELASAREQRDFVIRQVRQGVFWPPKQTSAFDGLAGVCADEAADRAALIAASAAGGGP